MVQEFCNKSLDKRQGSSDWNKDINELVSEKQLEYAANDVIYLHQIKIRIRKNAGLERTELTYIIDV